MATPAESEATDKNIAQWKIKKLIQNLERARGYVAPIMVVLARWRVYLVAWKAAFKSSARI
jgi:hypothetical protein